MKEDIINKIFDDTKAFLDSKQEDSKNIISNLKKDIPSLEDKKSSIEDLVISKTFDRDTYLKKINEVNSQIIAKKLQLSDYEAGIVNIDELVDYSKSFILNLSTLWLNLDTRRKRHLQGILFPEGVQIVNNEFRTAKISPILRLIQDKMTLKMIVSQSWPAQRCEISYYFLEELNNLKDSFSI